MTCNCEGAPIRRHFVPANTLCRFCRPVPPGSEGRVFVLCGHPGIVAGDWPGEVYGHLDITPDGQIIVESEFCCPTRCDLWMAR